MYLRNLREDLRAVKERDPAARNAVEIIFTYPGFHAVRWHRRAHTLWRWGLRFLPRLISCLTRFFTGVDIHPAAKIGRGLFIDHGMGVVIGETSEIGENVTIYQGATLGGTGKDIGKRHPTIEDDVMIAAGAKILGPFTVGKGSKIGAGAVVLSQVPSYSTVVGIPGRVVKRSCPRGKPPGACAECQEDCEIRMQSMDQVNLPDPVEKELEALRERIEALEQALRQAGKEKEQTK